MKELYSSRPHNRQVKFVRANPSKRVNLRHTYGDMNVYSSVIALNKTVKSINATGWRFHATLGYRQIVGYKG